MRFPSLLLCLLVALSVPPAHAQHSPVGKGSKIVSGGFSASTTKSGGRRASYLSLSPDVSFFVAPGLAVDAGLSLSANMAEGADYYTASIGPEINYYFRSNLGDDVAGAVLPYVTVEAAYLVAWNRYDDPQFREDSYRYFQLSAGPGLTYLLNEHVGLFAQATYNVLGRLDDENEAHQNSFALIGGLRVFLP